MEFWQAAEDNPETLHYFRFVNDLPLNKSHPDLRVNLLEYWQVTPKGLLRFSWVTDILIRRENAVTLMRIGRARRLLEKQPRPLWEQRPLWERRPRRDEPTSDVSSRFRLLSASHVLTRYEMAPLGQADTQTRQPWQSCGATTAFPF
ncbi:hypothetical protein [Desulfoglaeba alkanexedens]|uniref:hypothetical protein n=1 Tax=Desulfoglaeba alkanexedens TaxID=361111 RepID=UPI001476C934|nr:hypothetical protein [Desulfoglaeba alkanexedens]